MKVKCINSNNPYLTMGKIYTCHEESSIHPGTYFFKLDNGHITSVSRYDAEYSGMIFIDELRERKLKELGI